MKDINFDQFQSEFNSGAKVFAFGAPWCRDCKFAKPILDELSKEYAGKVEFFSIDVDKEEGIREAMKIRHIPTILFVKDGVEIAERMVEPRSKEAIEVGLKKLV